MSGIFTTNFGTLDWTIVIIYLIGIGGIGIVVNRYIQNVDDYLVGGRGSRTALNAATYSSTGLGLVTIMYASIEGVNRGFCYLLVPMIMLIVATVVGLSGFVVHRLRELRLVTIPEFYEKRFDKRTRIVAGIICALAGILNMGLFPKMGATFITFVAGWGGGGAETTVNLVTSILIVLVLVYTVLGGMVSVIVTDYLQFVLLSLGMAVGVYCCLSSPGLHWNDVIQTVAEKRGEVAFNPFHPGSYGWIYILWMVLHTLAAGISWGPEVSRALTAKDPKTSQYTFLLSAPGALARPGIPALWGIVAFCFIVNHPDLLAYFYPNGIENGTQMPDQAMPLLIGKVVPAGLLGLLVAGLLAAFMSTHDSYFLCWSSVLVRDVIAPLRRKPLSDKEQIWFTRIIITVIAAFLLIWGIWYELPQSVWDYMAVTGTVYLCGSGTVIIGGIYWKRASSAGALAALLAGLAAIAGIFQERIQEIIPWLNVAVLGLGTYLFSISVFVVVSLLFPDKPKPDAMEQA